MGHVHVRIETQTTHTSLTHAATAHMPLLSPLLVLGAMIFPTDPLPAASPGVNPQSRGALMAKLLGRLADSVNEPAEVQRLLSESTPLLLEPFHGVPSEDSVYGAGTPAERLRAYEDTMRTRIARAAESDSSDANARALEMMRDHVVACVMEEVLDGGDAAVRRLRGGRAAGATERLLGRVGAGVDGMLERTERQAGDLRRDLRTQAGPTATDAAIAGALSGFAFGKVIIGDPIFLAAAGAACYTYAHRFPAATNPRLCGLADRCACIVADVRARVA